MQELPIIIAHRGASGYRPEHTLAAYELAIDIGADFIELDLVITKDGVLIARHENELSETTDVAFHPQFINRQTTKLIDGETKTGYFAEDFTLAEIKMLKAKERTPQLRPQNTIFDGRFEIPTFQEVIDLVKRKSSQTGRVIGIYPETKHPTYFRSIGLPLEDILIETLQINGYEGSDAPVFIQSFEVSNLKYLSAKTNFPLVQLLNINGQPYDLALKGDSRSYLDLIKVEGLREISGYARAVGVHKNLLIPVDSNGQLLSPTSLMQDARQFNLLVHVWTFRNEDLFLPSNLRGHPQKEYELFFSLGVNGVFSDHPDTALAARSQGNLN